MKLYKYVLIALLLLLFSGCSNTSIALVSEPLNVSVTNTYTGHQFNAWNNTLTGVEGRSNIIDTKNNAHISIMTSTLGATTLSVYVSEDCINFVLCEDLTTKINAPTGDDTHIFFTAGARCYQLESSNNTKVNATIIAKP